MRLQVSYRSYWTRTLLDALRDASGDLTVKQLSDQTRICHDDIVATLTPLGLIQYYHGEKHINWSQRLADEAAAGMSGARLPHLAAKTHFCSYVLPI